jgi:hypothetical protein
VQVVSLSEEGVAGQYDLLFFVVKRGVDHERRVGETMMEKKLAVTATVKTENAPEKAAVTYGAKTYLYITIMFKLI